MDLLRLIKATDAKIEQFAAEFFNDDKEQEAVTAVEPTNTQMRLAALQFANTDKMTSDQVIEKAKRIEAYLSGANDDNTGTDSKQDKPLGS